MAVRKVGSKPTVGKNMNSYVFLTLKYQFLKTLNVFVNQY